LQKEAKEIIRRVKEASSAQEQLDAHKAITRLFVDFSDMSTLASIRNSLNTQDEFYEQEKAFLDENEPLISGIQSEFLKAFLASPFRAELESKLGKLLFINAEMELKAFDPAIIPEMQEENKLTTEYQKLLASAQIEFDGKVLNLSQLGPYMESTDRDVRRSVFKKRTEFFMAHEKELDELYDKLVKVRTAMARKLGFENYVPLGYLKRNRNCYGPKDVAVFREQVKKYLVPLAVKLREDQRIRLGLDKLSFIDTPLYFKEGNPKPQGTPEEIFEAGKKMYDELSSETSEFFRFMLDNELLDCLSKKGKAPGGYMTYLFKYESPFIFANFNGTSGDVDVMTHECGHALNGYLTRNIEILEYKAPTLDACEVHSMAMEFFTLPWMKLFFGDNTKRFEYMQLISALEFIPYGCSVDEFQHVVYENPDMTPKERKEAWMRIEREYNPDINYEDDPFFGKGGTWQRQSHIYSAPFYYIDYCLARPVPWSSEISCLRTIKLPGQSILISARRVAP
jgi:M3 family oligoendopeptidase